MGKWYTFSQKKGYRQKRPPEKKYVLVGISKTSFYDAFLNYRVILPACVVVGYLKNVGGDKMCPYFVTPGVNRQGRIVTHWCDCLGNDVDIPVWRF